MTVHDPSAAERKPLRAHAQRNRDALIAAARDAFTAGDADIHVEEIARRAGVGVGTFYRHFATREAIVEAVYDQRVQDLCTGAGRLLQALPPHEALRAFLDQLVEHSAASRSMAVALTSAMDPGSPVFTRGRSAMIAAIDRLMTAATATGIIRSDISTDTLFRAMGGICASHNQPDWDTSAREIVRVLYDGLRSVLPSEATTRIKAADTHGESLAQAN